jgi:hypothetical protein
MTAVEPVNGQYAGAWEELEGTFSDLVELVAQLDDDAPNWRPPAPDSNSIAVLVRHTIGSTSMWCAIALDEPFERDRDAEFRVHETKEALLDALREFVPSVRGPFERLGSVDPEVERRDPRSGEVHTVGWCVAHVMSHTGEHWGQIQLTRDLYRAGGSGRGTASDASVVRTPEERP